MNKTDWNDAPEWANYVAMDADGEWWWFEFEPKPHTERGLFVKQGYGKCAKYFTESAWFETLEKRP